ncbi:apolipo protein O-domain-containing protein [Sporodiniella umbellata]|nr:apolipo protein O-domain-containing protein [Sporodiniella umbellata]
MFSPAIKKSLAAAAAGAVWVSSIPVAFAEEKRKKLSIYDEPEPQVTIIESPTKLEEHVYVAQKYANETLKEGKGHIDGWAQKYQQLENDVTSNVKNTIDKDEELNPNLLYVGVAALAGTIIARNRNIVLRFLTSTSLAVGTSYYLLPKTTSNVFQHLERLEKKYPQIQAAHQSVNESVDEVYKQIDGTLAQLRGAVDENAAKLKEQFEQNSQLVKKQVNSAVGSTSAEAKDKFDEVKKNVESMYSTRSNPGVEETLKKN